MEYEYEWSDDESEGNCGDSTTHEQPNGQTSQQNTNNVFVGHDSSQTFTWQQQNRTDTHDRFEGANETEKEGGHDYTENCDQTGEEPRDWSEVESEINYGDSTFHAQPCSHN